MDDVNTADAHIYYQQTLGKSFKTEVHEPWRAKYHDFAAQYERRGPKKRQTSGQ